ncbi:MAG: LEA type 2 family protein [Woeseiaceae bacterium]
MKSRISSRVVVILTAVGMLSACAGTSTLVDSPSVNLTSVELAEVSFSRQTFRLGFDVDNPNPFPLPIQAVEYRVILDEEKFAGGATEGRFTVPAGGRDDFTISVDLDMLNSAAQLSSLLVGGMREAVSYELQGSLTVDIPFTKPLPFSSTGVIDVHGNRR